MSADEPKLETGKSKLETRNWKLVRGATALWTRFSNFAFRVSTFMARVPWKLVLGAAGLFILAWVWREHDARLRRDLELQQLRQQTSAQVAALRARADALLRAANEKNARVIRDLDSRRRQLEHEGEELRRQLLHLREQERARASEVASLPASELAERLAARLDSRGSGFGTRDSGRKEQVSGVGAQVSEKGVPDDQSPSPGKKSQTPDTRHLTPDTSPIPRPESRVASSELVLTEEGARQMETAFVKLDSCREQSAVKDGELANCQEQVTVNRAVVGEMNKSVNDLNQALRLQDEILARVQAEHRAELKAARGSRLGRFVRTLQYIGAGVVIGVVVVQ
jgi:hypothetical protein